MEETWKNVIDYENLYQVSNFGNIKRNNKILKPHLDRKGYLFVNLSKNGIVKCCRVHQLVAKAFLPNKENKKEVNHINGIKTDNRVYNLEWATHFENMEHAFKNNLISEQGIQRCVNAMVNATKKKVYQYKNGVLIKEYESCSNAVRETGIKHISSCAIGKRKTAGGFEWRYK